MSLENWSKEASASNQQDLKAAEIAAKSVVSMLLEREPELDTWHQMLEQRLEKLLNALCYPREQAEG